MRRENGRSKIRVEMPSGPTAWCRGRVCRKQARPTLFCAGAHRRDGIRLPDALFFLYPRFQLKRLNYLSTIGITVFLRAHKCV